MNLAALLALLSLTITDATGDAIGDGTLDPPTAPVYANLAVFDLQAVDLQVAEDGSAVLSVTMGALGPAATVAASEATGSGEEAGSDAAGSEPPADVAELSPEEAAAALAAEADQFDISGLLAVIDVYLDTGVDGAEQTLRGPNMVFPIGSSWRNAVRISAEGAWGVTYVGAAADEAGTAGGPDAAVADDSAGSDAGPVLEDEADVAALQGEADAALAFVPLEVSRRGNVLSVELPWSFEPEGSVDVYAVTGVHDPFSPDAWRPIAAASSPWAFSGGEQVAPVIDLLAPDAEAQTAALRTGVLPEPAREAGMTLPLSPWLWLMVGGLAVALFGLVLRGRVSKPAVAATADASASTHADEAPSDAPDDDAPNNDDPEVAATDEPTEGDPDEPVDVVATLLPFEAEDGSANGAEAGAEEEVAEDVEAASGSVLPEEPALVVEDDEAPAPDARDGTTYSTGADASYLGSVDDEDDLLFGDTNEAGESFWHPASRTKKTLVPGSAPEPSPLGAQADDNDRPTSQPTRNGSSEE